MRFDGKAAVVTGSTSGIGAQIARRLAEAGASVLVTGRSVDAGERVVEEITSKGGVARFVRCDLTQAAEVRAMVAACQTHFGGVDVLVNNAGPTDLIGSVERPLADESDEAFAAVLQVGLFGMMYATKAAIPPMLDAGGGAIVNISSIAGTVSISGVPAYSAMKGAVQSFSRYLAGEYGKKGIRSNCIIVGAIAETSTDAALQHPVLEQVLRRGHLTKDSHNGRPDDVAWATLFLASDLARYINGILMPVDGGLTCASNFPSVEELFAYTG